MARAKQVLTGVAIVGSVLFCGLFDTSVLSTVDSDGNRVSVAARILEQLRRDRSEQTAASPHDSFASYSSPETRISFRHPAFLSPEVETSRDRSASGELLELTVVHAESSDPFVALSILIHRDPGLSSRPEWYPPKDEALRFLAYYSLLSTGGEDREWSDRYEEAFWETTQSAPVIRISGFPAVAYSLALDDTPFGRLYLRGATVISPSSQTDIRVVAADDQDAPGHVPREALDRMWEELAASLTLPE